LIVIVSLYDPAGAVGIAVTSTLISDGVLVRPVSDDTDLTVCGAEVKVQGTGLEP
jgi:hypothetical protein